MRGVAQAIAEESNSIRLLPLDTSGVSNRLRGLPLDLQLTAIQLTLHVETVRCLECGAYRAAMVMAWNLAFDYLRQWIFDLHLQRFSDALVSSYTKKNGSPIYQPIDSYECFFRKDAPSERVILDVAKDLNLTGGEMYDHLCQYLRFRNNFAHPTLKSVSREQANAAIEHLIDIMKEPIFVRAVPKVEEATGGE